MQKQKILVYVSSATAVPYREGGQHGVGVFLGELTEPLEPLIAAGHELTFISPDGRAPHIDKNSYRLLYWGFNKKRIAHADTIKAKLDALGMSSPQKASAVIAKGLDEYDVLFIPGGHAPMTDILYKDWLKGSELNEETGIILQHFHDTNKITALICHASAVLAAAPKVNGKWIYEGYKMTCVTMLAEFLIEEVPPFKVMKGHIPDYPAKLLERSGAILKNQLIPMLSNVVEDRMLITGQDPYAAKELGQRLLEKMNKEKR
jgi:putative intracellular protease/amidase